MTELDQRYLGPLSPPIIVIGAFFFALLLRIIFDIEWHTMPYGTAPLLDAKSYDDWAISIVEGHYSDTHAFYQSPLYPYLLAILYKILGHSYLAASFLNAFLDSVTVALLTFLTTTFYGRIAGLITALLAASYTQMIFYTAPPMKEPLILFLLTGYLCAALWAEKENRLYYYLLAGFSLGLAVLARGNLLLLFIILPLFSWIRYRHKATRGILLFIISFIIPIVPLTIHNEITAHDFVPLTYADGFNLYIGHSPYANGSNAYPPEVSTDPEQERLNTTWIAENAEQRKLKPSEVSDYWRQKALTFARENPFQELKLFGLKIFSFWNDAENFDNYDMHFIKENFSSLLDLPLVSFWLVSTLALFTIASWSLPQKSEKSYTNSILFTSIFLYMLAVVIFYVTDRYRLPIVVFLLPLAGAAIPSAINLWQKKTRKYFIFASGIALLFLVIALHRPLNPIDFSAFDWGVLTTLYADKNDAPAAFNAFQKGLFLSPQEISAQAFIRTAELKEHLGHQAEAEQLVRKAAELYPEDGVALYNLGRLEASHGEWDKAIAIFNQSLLLSPTYSLTYFALAKVYERMGENDNAHNILLKGLAINPTDERLLSLAKSWGLN